MVESIGKDDSVLICYRLGSYVPVFRLRRSQERQSSTSDAAPGDVIADRGGISVAVLPFVDISNSLVASGCAQGITDELIHELVRTEEFRVTAAGSVAPLVAQAFDIPSLARKLGVQIVFEGTVREEENRLRITSRIVNADGFLIWSERLETDPDTESLFKVSEKTASAIVQRMRCLSAP
jgi:TolB-like protein